MDRQDKSSYLRGRTVRFLIIASGLAAFLVGFTVLIHSILGENPLGADFYTFWLAGKAMFVDHQNPYSAEVTLQKQMAVLGRPALPEEDQMAFAYPPYSLLTLIPFFWMSFDWGYASWLALHIVGFLSLLYFLFLPTNRPLSLTTILFYPVFFCLMVGNYGVMMAGIVLLFFGLVVARGSTTPGIQVLTALLFAWSTGKPQFIWLFTIFALLFAIKQRLHLFIAAYFASLLVFVVVSYAFVPGWISQWLDRIQEYAGYVNSHPVLSELLAVFLPERAALIFTGILFIILMLLTGHFFYRWWKGEMTWIKVLAWVGLITYLFHLHGIAYEQMVFLAPLLLWAGLRENRATARASLIFWFASLAASWLAFAGGITIQSPTLSQAADRSAVLLNAIWVAWLLLAKTTQPAGKDDHKNLATRSLSGDKFQV